MANDDEWESCRGSHEPDEHWELRKNFLAKNEDRFIDDKVRLLCLSQVFTNMEFLGCRYSTQTMELVAELSKGIVEDYREKKSARLQRTFIKASDAAKKDIRGKNSRSEEEDILYSTSPITEPTKLSEDDLKELLQAFDTSSITVKDPKALLDEIENLYIIINPKSEAVATLVSSLQSSCKKNHFFRDVQGVHVEEDGFIVHKCEFGFGNGNLIVRGAGKGRKDAKKDACREALRFLQQLCPTLQVKEKILAKRKVQRSELITDSHDNEPAFFDDFDMDWQEDGLDIMENGTSQVNDATAYHRSFGLAQEDDPGDMAQFRKNVIKFLNGEAMQYSEFDIEFASDFTKEERKIIHEAATISGCFKSKSHGKGDERFLVLSRKMDVEKLVQQVLERGGETEKHKVTLPKFERGSIIEMEESSKPRKIKLNTISLSENDLKEVLLTFDTTITVRDPLSLLNDIADLHLVFYQNLDAASALDYSLQACHKENYHKFNFTQDVHMEQKGSILTECELVFGEGNLIVSGVGKTQNDAKEDVCAKSLQFLQQLCPTLQVKGATFVCRKIERRDLIPNAPKDDPAVFGNSVVMNMMLKMGFKGGGLGPKENGISQPIDVSAQRGRVGLGQEVQSTDSAPFRKRVNKFLNRTALQYGMFDEIEFSPDFTSAERKIIHEVAIISGCFKIKSLGSGDKTFLVLSRIIDVANIVQQVLEEGGETEKYKVTLPNFCNTP